MSSIHDSTGALVTTYQDKPMPRSASPAAAQAVTSLMESVPISGTASGSASRGICARPSRPARRKRDFRSTTTG